MESTGKPVAFEGMLMFRVRDGKVVEAWNSFEFLKMFQQMGVVKLVGGWVKNIVCLAHSIFHASRFQLCEISCFIPQKRD